MSMLNGFLTCWKKMISLFRYFLNMVPFKVSLKQNESCALELIRSLKSCLFVLWWGLNIISTTTHCAKIYHITNQILTSVGGGHRGVPNTAVLYENLANTEIPCRKWTKYRYRIYDRWRLLNVVSISRVFFMSSMCTPEINLSLREKTWEDLELIGTKIEKPGHWMSYHIIE